MTGPWDRVWFLYDGNPELTVDQISAETGICKVRIWHAAWDRHRDDATRLNPRQRRRHRTLTRLRARLAINPNDAKARHSARRLGFNAPLRKAGRPRLPDTANQAIVEAHRADVMLKEIAAAEGLKLSTLAARVFKLQQRGVLQRRRTRSKPRQVAA